MRKSDFRKYLILLAITIAFTGCTPKEIFDYEYGVIHTSIGKEDSIVSTYGIEGEYLETHELNIGGLTLGAFMDEPIIQNDNIYLTLPVLVKKARDFIIELDKETFKYKKLNSEMPPTSYTVDDNFAYLGSSLPGGLSITKVSKDANKIIDSTIVEGIGDYLFEYEDELYGVCTIYPDDDTDGFTRLYILSKDDLSILNSIDISNSLSIVKAVTYNQKIYMAIPSNNSNGNDISNKLVVIDISQEDFTEYLLPFEETESIHLSDDKLLISELDGATVIEFDLDTHNMESYNLNNTNISSLLDKDVFYSSDGSSIFAYNLNDFSKVNEFKINVPEDMLFISFYIK